MMENLILIAFIALPLVLAGAVYVVFAKWRWHRRADRAWWMLPVANVLVLAALLSLPLPVGEVYFRFIYDTTDAYSLSRVSQEWFLRHYRYNQANVRDSLDTYNVKMRPGIRRVSFLGDSFTVGHGVKDVEMRFANIIRAQHPDWEVHALAQNGVDLGVQLTKVKRMALGGYAMDIVVLVYCLNDITDLIPPWQAIMKRMYDTKPPVWTRHSYLLDTMFHRWVVYFDEDLRDYYDFIPKAYDSHVWPTQQKRLRTLRDMVTSRGGHFVVVTFPFVHQMQPDSPYRQVHATLNEFWSQLNVPHLDLLPVLESYLVEALVVNGRDPHPNEKAHALAADAIAQFVEQQMQRPRK